MYIYIYSVCVYKPENFVIRIIEYLKCIAINYLIVNY